MPSSPPSAFDAAIAFLQKGGPFMIPLVLCSFIGIAAIIYKALALRRERVIPVKLADDVEHFRDRINADKIEPILHVFRQGQSTLARLGNVVVRHRGKPQRDIILAVEAASREESSRLHSGMGVLETVITVAPLLGLLGTASGLVTIFRGLSDAADHLRIAQGIAEALNTTIFGLAIAVPCVIAHSYFTRRIEVLSARLETLLADLASECQRAKQAP